MRFIVKHEIRGRIRVHLCRRFLTIHQADVLEQYLQSLSCVREVRIYERTADAAIVYTGKKEELTEALQRISLEHLEKSGKGGAISRLADDLPLFAALREREQPQFSPLNEALRVLNPDELSPREALEKLYEIKRLQESLKNK